MSLPPGVYAASVTPLDARGRPDELAMARLLARFEATGCQGAVLAGTNGEGPSLSATEKRDLLRDAMPAQGRLKLILGVATPSLDEAIWLCRQAATLGAAGALVMPPYYYRGVSLEGVREWYERLLDVATLPVILYTYPKMTGVTLEPELVAHLALRENVSGVKDSSGETGNLATYRQAVPEGKSLLVGDERLLLDALRAGWTGSISGVANLIPDWLSQIVQEWSNPDLHESAETKFELVRPVIEGLRAMPQPAANKAIMCAIGVLERDDVRPPLVREAPEAVAGALDLLRTRLGLAGPRALGAK